MDKPVRLVACPRCGSRVAWSRDNPSRPFCSERCKLIDLGAWATERYRIPDSSGPDSDRSNDDPEER